MEGVSRNYVRHIGQHGFKLPARVVIEHPILTPSELPSHQFVLDPMKRMKRMVYAESPCGESHTTCI